jgi:hypothetical protein
VTSILEVGLASPLGLGREEGLAAWLEGGEVKGANKRWNTEGFPRSDAGQVEGFIAKEHLPDRKAVKLMSRETQLAVFAAVEAAGLDLPARWGVEATRFGAFAATGYEVCSLADSEAMLAASRDPSDPGRVALSRLFTEGRDVYNPLSPLKILPNMPLFHAGLALGFQGPHLSLGSSPAAGLAALGEASESLIRGHCDAALVLGCDAQIEEFRAQLLVEAGVLPSLAPAEGAAALLLGHDEGKSPRIVAWDMAQEPCGPCFEELGGSSDQRTLYGRSKDGGATRRALYSRVLEGVGPVDLCFSDLWGAADRDGPESFALSDQPALTQAPRSNRSRLGWLGAAAGLVDVAIACELIRTGHAQRALITASGLAGDLAAVVLEGRA